MNYDPNFLSGNGIPTDRITRNAWCRNFAAYESIVYETIEFYSSYLCKFLHIAPLQNKDADNFVKYQTDKISLNDLIPQILKEYLIVGECFVYAELDETLKMWSRLHIQNPDYIVVRKSVTNVQPEISLRPDEKLRTLVLKQNPSEDELRRLSTLDKSTVECIKRGENIPLDNFYVSHFCRRQSPYEVRGDSILLPVLKSLMLLQKSRNVSEEYIDFSYQNNLKQEIMESLGHPSILTKPNHYIRKDVAKVRVMQQMQLVLIPWVQTKIFAPVAKMNDYYEYKDGSKQLIIPSITFDHESFSKALENDYAQISAST